MTSPSSPTEIDRWKGFEPNSPTNETQVISSLSLGQPLLRWVINPSLRASSDWSTKVRDFNSYRTFTTLSPHHHLTHHSIIVSLTFRFQFTLKKLYLCFYLKPTNVCAGGGTLNSSKNISTFPCNGGGYFNIFFLQSGYPL